MPKRRGRPRGTAAEGGDGERPVALPSSLEPVGSRGPSARRGGPFRPSVAPGPLPSAPAEVRRTSSERGGRRRRSRRSGPGPSPHGGEGGARADPRQASVARDAGHAPAARTRRRVAGPSGLAARLKTRSRPARRGRTLRGPAGASAVPLLPPGRISRPLTPPPTEIYPRQADDPLSRRRPPCAWRKGARVPADPGGGPFHRTPQPSHARLYLRTPLGAGPRPLAPTRLRTFPRRVPPRIQRHTRYSGRPVTPTSVAL